MKGIKIKFFSCGMNLTALSLLSGVSDVYALPISPEMQISEDRFNHNLKLNLTLEHPNVVLRSDGQFSAPLKFYIYSNYSQLIKTWQLTVYRDEEQLTSFTPDQVTPYQPITWQGELPLGQRWQPNTRYRVVLTAKDAQGKTDIVEPVYFDTLAVSERIEPLAPLRTPTSSEPDEIPGFGLDRTQTRGIVMPANSGKARIQFKGLNGLQQVSLNGIALQADEQGNAIYETILAPGEHTFALRWQDAQGEWHEQQEQVSLGSQSGADFFYVAMVDLTWSQNRVTGPGREVLLTSDAEHFEGKGNWDGRVLFYVKGHFDDEYRLTAHMDTTETRLKNVFGRLGDRDPRRFTRELDPMDYYPIYGDDSTVESDIDTQGKFYLKLEKGKDHLLWGNYNTGFTGTELAAFNRSLYGAEYWHESEELTLFDEPVDYLSVFAANSETRGSHNEFLSTGGSLYFLKHQRVTSGSLKLAVEIRDPDTGRLKHTSALSEGTDYEIDAFQGRILLTRALPMNASGGIGSSIITGDGLLQGDEVWLVADYEYYSDGFALRDQAVQGARAYRWLGDHVRVGTTFVQEEKEQAKAYKLYGVDLRWKPAIGTETILEYAHSQQSASDIYLSENGGLDFRTKSISSQAKGNAWKVEQEIDFQNLAKLGIPLWMNGYFSKKEQGFSTFSLAREETLTEWGASLRYDFETDKKGIVATLTSEQENHRYRERIESLQAFTDINDKTRSVVELQSRRENNFDEKGETRELLGAFKLERELFGGRDLVYLIQQLTLDKQGEVTDNNKTTLGYESQLTADLNVAAEAFTSNRGSGGGLGINYDVNERASVYTKVTNDIDSNAGRGITTVLGGNWQATDKTELYSERQFKSLRQERSTSDIYGVKYQPLESHLFDLSYATGTIHRRHRDTQSVNGAPHKQTRRDVYIFGYGYKGSDIETRNKLEYRQERGEKDLHQWVMTNRAKTREYNGWSWLAQFDYARTGGDSDVLNNFTEAAIGFAWRPIEHNRLNLFGKVTYLRGMDPDDQFIVNTDTDGSYLSEDKYEQRSMVYALEGVYEWNVHWSTALKVAHRRGDLRYRDEKDWYTSDATLYAGRVDYHFNPDWSTQLEYRVLETGTAEDRKQGWVTSVYHQVNDHARVGVGYNWTDYNDDLTRLNYRSRGWFVSIVGSW